MPDTSDESLLNGLPEETACRIREVLSKIEEEKNHLMQTLSDRESAFSALNSEYTAYKQDIEGRRHEEHLRTALLDAGANPQAVDLLLAAAPKENETDDQLLFTLKSRYPAFFSVPIFLPTDPVSPPVSAAPPLTQADVRRMTQEEITRNWSAVCSVLSKGE